MGLRGIVLGVAVLAGVIAAPGVPTADAMPANDVRDSYAQMFVPDPDLTGVRRKAERVAGTVIDPDSLAAPSDDMGDPPLIQPQPLGGLQPSSTCFAGASVLADPTAGWYAQRTAWYEVTQDATGAPFDQATLVTIDTGGSSFASALEVFSGSAPPVAFDQSAPVLPANVVACDRNPSTVIPSVVSFLTKPNTRYFLMAGVLPPVSTTPLLRLSMRILDVETPVVSIKLEDAPDVKEMFEYVVSSNDPSASGPKLTVSQGARRKPVLLPYAALGAHCDKSHLKRGQYCTIGQTVRVRWRPIGSTTPVFGTVSASYTDRAGNVGSNSLQTQLRDREPPLLSSNTTARWTRRGRLFVTATCFKGPGTIEVQVGAAKKHVKTIPLNSQTMRLKRAFPEVRRRTTFVHVICRDRSKNADDTWLFLPG